MGETNRFEKYPKLTFTIFILVILGIIDLIVGTLVLTKPADHKGRIANPYFNHTLESNFKGDEPWSGGRYAIYTNNFGFKDWSNREVPLATNLHRIVFMGDSFTEGIGVPYEKTWVGLVEQKLGPRGFDILNAGAAGYSPTLYYLKMKYYIEHGLKLDELVVFVDESDNQNELALQSWKPTTPNFLRTSWDNFTHKIDFFLEHHSLTYLHIIRPILLGYTSNRLYSLFVDQTALNAKEAKYVADMGRWTFDDAVWNDWGKNGAALEVIQMNNLYDLCEKNNIKMSIAVYPWPVQIEEKDIDSRQVTIWRDYAKKHNIDFYNFFPTFIATTTSLQRQRETYFLPNDNHWSEGGHEVIAGEFLTEYLKNNKK